MDPKNADGKANREDTEQIAEQWKADYEMLCAIMFKGKI